MAEPYLGADIQQLLCPGGDRRIRSQCQRPCGPPQQRGVPRGVGGRQQHELPGWLRQHPNLVQVVVLELARHAGLARAGEAASQLGFGHPPGQLQQPQRISTGLGDDPGANPLVQVTRNRGRQQGLRVLVGKPLEGQCRQPGKQPLSDRLADGQQQANRLGLQPPSDKAEHLRRGLIQPLGIIDQADQRAHGGTLSQKAQDRQAQDEPVRSRPSRQPERHPQRALLRLRQRVQAAQ